MRRHYKSIIVVALALITLALMQLDRNHLTPDDSTADAPGPASLAPDVTFTLADGGELRLRSLAGHKLLLHFWASWCAPCREEFPALMERMEKDTEGTILLTVSADENPEDARRFLAPYRRDFSGLFASGKILVAQDPRRAIIEGIFQSFQYPETIVIGPDLSLREKIAGALPPSAL